MSRTDLISDVFTIIRNAIMVRHEETLVPHSNILMKICDILKRENYIENYKEVELKNFKNIKIYLKYNGKKSAISQIRRVSTPGLRVYVTRKHIPSVLRGHGIAIISTSKGIFTDKEAREACVGGEVLGKVW